MPELRKDPISGRWVIIAGERARRPHQFAKGKDPARQEPCPFCTGNEAMTPAEVLAYRNESSPANSSGWSVRVVPNKYPALVGFPTEISATDSIYQSSHALGAHEVIIESAEHVVNLRALPVESIAQILRAYRERMIELRKDPRWRYLLIYKNQGDRAGATLEHIHSQLIALPTLPAQAADELRRARRHYDSTRHCMYCAMMEREINASKRLVLSSERFVALCPFAPRFAYETWILPRRHAEAFEQTSDEELADLASVLKGFIGKLSRALDDPPFNYLIQSLCCQSDSRYHWRIEILPQVSRAAGFEWGTGMHINSVAPEQAARLLRETAV
jgi:UDPglucose--hexose-1-phosphate uridylyltransferase